MADILENSGEGLDIRNLNTGSDFISVTHSGTSISVNTISVIPGSGATNLGKTEDAVHSSGDIGVMSLGVRKDAPAAIAADGDYIPFTVSEVGGLWTEHVPNEVDSSNSSTDTLNSGVTFTGTGIDILDHDIITVTLDASHDSATDGMTFQFSIDNSNWDDIYLFTYTAADGARRFQFPVTSQFFRVVYTNGGTNQTHFRLQTILHHANTLTTIHRLVDDTNNDRSAQVVKAAIIAQKAGGGPGAGDFVAVQSTAAGNLKMSVQEISDGLDIGAGNAGAETQRVSISTDDVNMSAIKTATETTADWDNAVGDGASVSGDIANDSPDAGEPVKVGGKAIDMTPDTDAEQGPSEVAADDRVNALLDLKGRLMIGVNARYNVLDNISVTYDADPTTAVSSAVDCWEYRHATLSYELDRANTPTDIVFEVEVSLDGTNYTKLMNKFLGDLRHSDTSVGSGIEESIEFPIACQKIRVRVTALGTDGTDTFTVANAQLYLRD